MDEPLSNLDAKVREEMRSELKSIQRQAAVTTLYVTHDQEEALALSDRVVLMSEGRIAQMGSPSEIYLQPRDRFVASFVGKANILEGEPVGERQFRVTGGLVLTLNLPLPAGTKAVAVRPEHLFVRPPTGAPNVFEATVRTVTYTGAANYVLCDLAGMSILVLVINTVPERTITPGESLPIAIQPEAIRPLAPDPPRRSWEIAQ
jgi:ABC-type Fe3+/spermidine/putrescine transport system ATPase subunit